MREIEGGLGPTDIFPNTSYKEGTSKEPIATLFGAVAITVPPQPGVGAKKAEMYIGLSNSGDLIATFNQEEIEPEQFVTYQRNLSKQSTTRKDLSSSGVTSVIPLRMGLGGISVSRHISLQSGSEEFVHFRVMPPLRVGNMEFGQKEVPLDILLREFLAYFKPDNQKTFMEFRVPGEKESRIGMLIRYPNYPKSALAIFFEEKTKESDRIAGNLIGSWATTHEGMKTLVTEIQALRVKEFDFTLNVVRSTADYRRTDRGLLKDLMELQAIAEVFESGEKVGLFRKAVAAWGLGERVNIKTVQKLLLEEGISESLTSSQGKLKAHARLENKGGKEIKRSEHLFPSNANYIEAFDDMDSALGEPSKVTSLGMVKIYLDSVYYYTTSSKDTEIFREAIRRLKMLVDKLPTLVDEPSPNRELLRYIEIIKFRAIMDIGIPRAQEGDFSIIDEMLGDPQTGTNSNILEDYFRTVYLLGINNKTTNIDFLQGIVERLENYAQVGFHRKRLIRTFTILGDDNIIMEDMLKKIANYLKEKIMRIKLSRTRPDSK